MRKTEIEAGTPPARTAPRMAPVPRSRAVMTACVAGAPCGRGNHRTKAPGPRVTARRIAGCKVSESFYERIHGRVTDVLPILKRGIAYDCEVLCGSAFMVRLPPGRRLRVDACLADTAARGALPLEPVLDGADAPPRYRLRDGTSDCVSPSAAIALLNISTNVER